MRGATSVMAAATAGLVVFAGAVAPIAAKAPAQADLTAKKEQRPKREPHIAPGMNSKGKTQVVGHSIRTNAGNTATVRVTARTTKGTKVGTANFRVTRTSKGRVVVWSSGKKALRVRLHIHAPATKNYTKYEMVKKYRTSVYKKPNHGYRGGPPPEAFKIMDWLIEAVAGEVVGHIFGYGVGALFGSDSKGTDLKPVLDQLNQIKGQLVEIQGQISELSKELKYMHCDIETSLMAESVAKIEAYNNDLKDLIAAKNTNETDLMKWANDATNNGQVASALGTINKITMGQAGAGGSIKACTAAFLNDWVKPLDEDGYYVKVWQYMKYFQYAQMLGVNVLTEAFHVKAMQAAKNAHQMPKPVDATKICAAGKEADARVVYNCNRALSIVNEVYWNMTNQTIMAGAGFAWNIKSWDRAKFSEPSMSIAKGTPLVWIRDLSRFDGAAKACGPGPYDSASKKCQMFMNTQYLPRDTDTHAGYFPWSNANVNQWADLLNTPKSPNQKISQIMEGVGFTKGTANKMIIYSRGGARDSSFTNPWFVWTGGRDFQAKMPIAANQYKRPATGQCLMDTNFVVGTYAARWPACADPGGMTMDTLLGVYTRVGHDHYRYTTPQWVLDQGSDRDFYTGQLDGDITWKQGGFWQSPRPTKAPGWLNYGVENTTKEYQWPVYNITRTDFYKCKTLVMDSKHKFDLSMRNAGGAYTMCGDDFEQWLKSWWPKPPRPPA